MYDKLGTLIEVDDEILYAKGAQSDDSLYLGTVIEADKGNQVKLLAHDSKRKLYRHRDNVINISPVKKANPENFI